MKIKKRKVLCGVGLSFFMILLTLILFLFSIKTGSMQVTWIQIIRGLFLEYDDVVASIYDMRFPRIIISLLSGGALSASGLLFQSALKNPLADPGIIGISGGSTFVASLVAAFFPTLYFSKPLFACLGGLLAYFIIYALAWRGGFDPVRIILVGIAVAAAFSGLTEIFSAMTSAYHVSLVGATTQLVWRDVHLLFWYALVGIVGALMLMPGCNIMALEDQTIRSLGINVDRLRLAISGVAVLLCAGVTSIIGVIGFLALVVPHMARRLVGNNHFILTPFTIILGAFVMLFADTLGRLAFGPCEIPAAIIMNVVGGPFFIFLLRREVKRCGS